MGELGRISSSGGAGPLVSWHLWKELNSRAFRGTEATVQQLRIMIKLVGEMWISAGATHLGCLFSE
uniref:Uncharacterized protein n=1 Tax=Setaria viridis TaxID=4556 RepID=A0A4U6UQ28_SETVI|nr:hypothetical protein SEVIR_5G430050v2 [Setaria viridis]